MTSSLHLNLKKKIHLIYTNCPREFLDFTVIYFYGLQLDCFTFDIYRYEKSTTLVHIVIVTPTHLRSLN